MVLSAGEKMVNYIPSSSSVKLAAGKRAVKSSCGNQRRNKMRVASASAAPSAQAIDSGSGAGCLLSPAAK